MSPESICRDLYEVGIYVRSEEGRLLVSPMSLVTPEMRQLLQDHKPVLLDFLAEVNQQAADLIAAAMRVCDHHGDGDQARADMRADCMATPPHLRGDLLDHFTSITSTTAENSAEPDPEHSTTTPAGPEGNP